MTIDCGDCVSESTAPFKIKLFDDIKEAKNSGDSVFKFLLKVGTLFASTSES